jgi:ABC-type uncharacterized transport system ATPase subunit
VHLQLKHITKTFGNGDAQTEVLKNINFSVNQGEFIIPTFRTFIKDNNAPINPTIRNTTIINNT